MTLTRLSRRLLTGACLLAVLPLPGCFSMSAVPPPSGLSQVDAPDAHDVASFDASAGSEVESDWGENGKFVLLHPTLNGADVGWFIFDTGASGCTITARAAKKAGLVAVGITRLQGETRTTVFRCDEIRAGPLRLEGVNVTGVNMSHSKRAFGREVVGILGRNVCESAIVEIEGPQRAVRLHAPAGFVPVDAAAWRPIEMRRKLPHVRCEYAGEGDGLFVIDTGADATVHFLGSAVERHALTESPGVTITGGRTQITFGSVGRIAEGVVDDFRIGGQQFGPVAATFAIPGDAPSRLLPDVDGMIGMGLMRDLHVLIDEREGRVAFQAAAQAGVP